jgi:hypothetical protein
MKENNQQKTRRGRKPLGDEKRQVIKITLPPSQIQALLRLLKITGESVSNFTERAIKEAIYKEMLDASRFAADLLKKDTALKPEPKRIPAPIQFQEPTPLPTNIIEIPLFGSVAAGTPAVRLMSLTTPTRCHATSLASTSRRTSTSCASTARACSRNTATAASFSAASSGTVSMPRRART